MTLFSTRITEPNAVVSAVYTCWRRDILGAQVNLDMTDSMGPGKLVRHMQNPSYAYDEYLVCIGLGPTIQSVICKNPSYSGPSYPSSPVYYSGPNQCVTQVLGSTKPCVTFEYRISLVPEDLYILKVHILFNYFTQAHVLSDHSGE